MLFLRSCNHTSTDIQCYRMLGKKTCACQIVNMYDLVRATCGFFNLLKVYMFLNPTDIKPTWAAANNYLFYNPEGEVSAEFRGLPQTNPSLILLNMGYTINC